MILSNSKNDSVKNSKIYSKPFQQDSLGGKCTLFLGHSFLQSDNILVFSRLKKNTLTKLIKFDLHSGLSKLFLTFEQIDILNRLLSIPTI